MFPSMTGHENNIVQPLKEQTKRVLALSHFQESAGSASFSQSPFTV